MMGQAPDRTDTSSCLRKQHKVSVVKEPGAKEYMSWIENVPPSLLHISVAVYAGKTRSLIQRDPAAGQHHHGLADVLCGTEPITEHLHHMGNGLIPEPVTDDTVPIVDPDGQRETEGLCGIARQYTDRTPEVSMDKSGFGRVL